ncbi:MAG: hypothetical protein IPK32_09240 [Verrucomicrobiaceae bacterium]|nr:hypothetical protein [Verrucomicrobiaceae bacterium]
MKTPIADYDRQVFINCPFDDEHLPLLRAMVFAIHACGYKARCALEVVDAGEVRLSKILRLIESCRYGLHDISRTSLDAINGLPRFNMPLELGLFLGAARFGNIAQRRKRTLILDVERFRYQKFVSDIAGQDIKAHGNDPLRLIGAVRDWLNASSATASPLPGSKALIRQYQDFLAAVPPTLVRFRLHESEVSFVDWLRIVEHWLENSGS